MADNETTADIIADKRFDATTRDQFDSAYIVDFCDRIEAAWKRERENYDAKIADLQLRVKLWTDRSDELVKKCVEQYAKLKQVGNSAKLREVVRKLLDALYDMGIDEHTLAIAVESPNCKMKSEHTLSVFKEARAALAAPPRNCDVIGNTGRALVVHGFPTKSNQWGEGEWLEFVDWLLAPTTEKEGGCNAD